MSKNLSRLVFLSLIGWSLAFAPAVKAESNSIESVSATSLQAGKTVVKINLKQAVSASPASFSINNPPRLAFDFADTGNGLGKNAQNVGEGSLRSINLVQANGRTRLVMNLTRPVTYESQIEGNSLLVTMQTIAEQTSASTSTSNRFAAASPNDQQHAIRDVDFRRGKDGEGRIVVDLSDNATGINMRQQGKTIVIDFAKTSLPRNLERRLEVTDFATPVQTVDAFSQGGNARLVIEPKGLWEHSAYQADTRFIVEVKPIVEDPNKLIQGGKPGYKGEKLSLNFQNVEVRSVLQVIADFTGLNIITSDTVSGNLTLRLKDVPWDQALDIILESKGLDKRKNGNVVWIAPRDELATRDKLALEAQQQIAELEPTRTEAFQLNYQKADAVQKLLSDPTQKVLSKRGSAINDARTNTLFVQDTPSKLEEVRALINKIDVPVRQVMIEARIVEASDTFSKNLGFRFGNVSSGLRGSGHSTNVATTGRLEDFTNLFPASPTANPTTVFPTNLAVNLPAAAISGATPGAFALQISNSLTGLLFLEISALEADGRGKVISSPRVVTADQVEATIEQGTDIPFQQATSSGATSVTFKKAVLSLKVKPQITPDENIIMNLQVNKDNPRFDQPVAGGVPIDTKQVQTQVLVDNGGTVVIGGIYQQTLTNNVNKIPLLGDLPVFGGLFRNKSEVDNRNELLVFITPRILKDHLSAR
ncbi:MAG: type IV pilus secretin PilQ [Burkholderiales bacterium]